MQIVEMQTLQFTSAPGQFPWVPLSRVDLRSSNHLLAINCCTKCLLGHATHAIIVAVFMQFNAQLGNFSIVGDNLQLYGIIYAMLTGRGKWVVVMWHACWQFELSVVNVDKRRLSGLGTMFPICPPISPRSSLGRLSWDKYIYAYIYHPYPNPYTHLTPIWIPLDADNKMGSYWSGICPEPTAKHDWWMLRTTSARLR